MALAITIDTSGGGDTAAPILQSFSSTSADGSYGPGASISITATFDEALRGDSTLTVVLDNGQSVVLAAVSGSTLTGTYTVGATGSAQDSADLTVGSISSASVFDLAGNEQTGTTVPAAPNNLGDTRDIVVDTLAPTGSVDLLPGSDTGNDSDNITSDTTPTLRVSLTNAEVGDSVELLLVGASFSTPLTKILDVTDISNGYVDFTVANGALGANGIKSLTARLTDSAENSSTTAALEIILTTGSVTLTLIDPNAPTVVELEPPGITNGYDYEPQIAALGGGAYAVTWQGYDNTGDSSIFVQAFNADGTANGETVRLDSLGFTYYSDYYYGYDYAPQIAAVGSGGYAVTWYGYDNTGDSSIFVQAFNADGTVNGTTVQLEAPGVTNGYDQQPQITAVGTAGAYAVTWQGYDNTGDSSIFVQAFNADGTTNGVTAQFGAPGVTYGYDSQPQITAVGTAGAYAVTWQGYDSSGGDYSIFVQAFNADGTTNGATVQLDAPGVTTYYGYDYAPQIASVGTAGAYAVTWTGYDSTGDTSIFVQAFNADGTTNGDTVQLEAPGVTNGYDSQPQIAGVGTAGAYVVTWYGPDSSGGDYSIFVQAFNADGTTNGSTVRLEAPGITNGYDYQPQITAVGTDGAYAITWQGSDDSGYSIFVQAFNADGTLGSTDQLDALPFGYDQQPQITDLISAGAYAGAWSGQDAEGDYSIFAWSTATRSVVVQLNEPGTVYLVSDSITVDDLADITGAADGLWNSAVVAGNTFAYIPRSGLQDGTYRLYAFDSAGNLSTASGETITIDGTDSTVPSGSVDLLASSDSGVSDSDNITNDTTPTFRVTLANAEEGDRVELLRNGNAFATPIVQVLDATDLSNGYVDFTVTAGHLGGNGVQGINAVVSDPAGNSSTSLTLELTLDTAAPVVSLVDASAPTIVKLEPPGVTNGYDYEPQIAALGGGAYAVTWQGYDNIGDTSIFVQAFNADGTVNGATAQLEAPGVTNGYDQQPQIAALGGGAYAVTWYGQDSSGGDYSIFVQAFNADGTTNGATVQLETPGVTHGYDYEPQITRVGTAGAYAVTWYGPDSSGGDYSIFVQAFNADGTTNGATVQLEAPGVTHGYDYRPQITGVGTAGAYAVTWYGQDSSGGDYSIFVQAFNANGTANGGTVQLEAPGVTNGHDQQPQIAALGGGAYAVTWYGPDSSGRDYSIFVQAFNADGTTNGATVQLEAPGVTNGYDSQPQITGVGSDGAYVVTWYGPDSSGGDYSIFVQAFNADGTTNGDTVRLGAPGSIFGYDYQPQITAVGTDGAYAVTWQGSGAWVTRSSCRRSMRMGRWAARTSSTHVLLATTSNPKSRI